MCAAECAFSGDHNVVGAGCTVAESVANHVRRCESADGLSEFIGGCSVAGFGDAVVSGGVDNVGCYSRQSGYRRRVFRWRDHHS